MQLLQPFFYFFALGVKRELFCRTGGSSFFSVEGLITIIVTNDLIVGNIFVFFDSIS